MSDQALDFSVGYPMDVRRQVWESLVSMLRVYAHAASLNGGEYLVAGDAEVASVTSGSCVLRISFSAESGAAKWCLTQALREEWGEFRIDVDGTLVFPAGTKELDAAAIEWIDHLAHASCGRSRRYDSSHEQSSQPLGIS